jgi:RimJ/RimL family protein N-acetyltransferase
MLATNLLHGPRVRLAAMSPDDAREIARWHQDAEFLRLFDARPAYPRGEAELLRWLEDRQKEDGAFIFAVRPLDSDELIGSVELEGILWPHRHAWLSIAIGNLAWRGQGYGAEALGLALGFAFDELNLHRVQLTVFSYNQVAIALYEKLGFSREGVYREHLRRDGTWHDMYLYGLLRREWEAWEPSITTKTTRHQDEEG